MTGAVKLLLNDNLDVLLQISSFMNKMLANLLFGQNLIIQADNST